jgi:hypothetical protein
MQDQGDKYGRTRPRIGTDRQLQSFGNFSHALSSATSGATRRLEKDRERFGLLFRLSFDDGDLSGGLFADLDLRQCDLLLAASSINLPKHDI